jgi:hypothetical protein
MGNCHHLISAIRMRFILDYAARMPLMSAAHVILIPNAIALRHFVAP